MRHAGPSSHQNSLDFLEHALPFEPIDNRTTQSKSRADDAPPDYVDISPFYTVRPLEDHTEVSSSLDVLGAVVRSRRASSGPFQKVCKGVESAVSTACDQTVKYPVSAKVINKSICNNRCCTWSCGQEKCLPKCCSFTCDKKCTKHWCCKGRFPNYKCGNLCEICVDVPCTSCRADKCGIGKCIDVPCSGCSKMQCGEFCAKIPDRLELEYQSRSLCDLVGLSGLTGAIEKATKFCPCMDKVVKYLADGLGDIADEGGTSAATTAALEAAASIFECFVESMNIRSEKAQIMKAEETRGGVENAVLLPGVEIGIKFYAQIVGAAALCISAGECQGIIDTLHDLFEDTAKKLGKSLVGALQKYLVLLLSPVKRSFDKVRSLEDQFYKSMNDCVEEVSKNSRRIVANIERVFKSVEMGIKNIENLVEEISQTSDEIGPAIDTISEVIEAYSDSFVGRIQSSILSGDIDGLVAPNKVVDFIKNSQEIDDAINGIKRIATLATTIQDGAQSVQRELKDVKDSIDGLSEVGEKCESLATSSLLNMREAMVSLRDDLLGAVETGLGMSLSSICIC